MSREVPEHSRNLLKVIPGSVCIHDISSLVICNYLYLSVPHLTSLGPKRHLEPDNRKPSALPKPEPLQQHNMGSNMKTDLFKRGPLGCLLEEWPLQASTT